MVWPQPENHCCGGQPERLNASGQLCLSRLWGLLYSSSNSGWRLWRFTRDQVDGGVLLTQEVVGNDLTLLTKARWLRINMVKLEHQLHFFRVVDVDVMIFPFQCLGFPQRFLTLSIPGTIQKHTRTKLEEGYYRGENLHTVYLSRSSF